MLPSAFLWLFCSLVSAVLMEDAFANDWLLPLVGSVEKYDIVSPLSVVAMTDLSQLVKLAVAGNTTNVEWRADLSDSTLLGYQISPNGRFIVSWDAAGTVTTWDTTSGVMIQEHKQVTTVVSEPAFLFDLGIVVLCSDELVLLLHDGSRKVISSNVNQFKFCQKLDLAYVITDDGQLYTIAADDLIVSRSKIQDLSFLEIIDMRDGMVVTKNAFIPLDSDKHVGHSSKGNVRYLSNGYFFTIQGSRLEITKVGSDAPVYSFTARSAIKRAEVTESVAQTLAVYTDVMVTVIELNDLLLTGHSDAVTSESYAYDATTPSAIFHDSRVCFVVGSKSGNLILLESSCGERSESSTIEAYQFSGKSYLLVDKPQSESSKELLHSVLAAEDNFVLTSWLLRVKRHLSELGSYAYSFASHTESSIGDSFSREIQFGLDKLLVIFDEKTNTVVALETGTGNGAWSTSLEAHHGQLISAIASNDLLYFVFENSAVNIGLDGVMLSTDLLSNLKAAFKIEDRIYAKTSNSQVKLLSQSRSSSTDYYVDIGSENILGFEIQDEIIRQTWTHKPSGNIITALSMPGYHQTASAGIARSDKTILYKYLNRNLVGVLSEENGNLVLELIDGITGNQIYVQKHNVPSIDLTTVSLTMADNWIVYSYYVASPHWEQRITVVDLFNDNYSTKEESAFDVTAQVNAISKTFIYCERILSLTATYSKYGITLKSIIALTANGRAIELPKFILNSRRIDNREMKQDDYQDDFRMLPYEAVIPMVGDRVINHVDKLLVSNSTQVIVKDTELESTSVVCIANEFNIFCTTVQPSLSYDVLNSKFDKFKLVLTLIILSATYLVSKPFVASKKLNFKWIDDS